MHHEDAPAVIDFNGYKEWWLDGTHFLLEKNYKKELKKYKREKNIK